MMKLLLTEMLFFYIYIYIYIHIYKFTYIVNKSFKDLNKKEKKYSTT